MIKRFYICILTLYCISLSNLNAQNAKKDLIDTWSKFILASYRQQPKKKLKAISDCVQYAEEVPDLGLEEKMLYWYMYMDILSENDPYNMNVLLYADKIWKAGYDANNNSYGMELILVRTCLTSAKSCQAVWNPIFLSRALIVLGRMKRNKVKPEVNPELILNYTMAGINVSEDEYEWLLVYASEQMKSISGEEWYQAAQRAMKDPKGPGNRNVVAYCVEKSEKLNYLDSWALHGIILEGWSVWKCDSVQALEYYRQAKEKGSVLGTVKYAEYLIDGYVVNPDYEQAYKLLSSMENNPDFLIQGGGYQLGRLYENGLWVKQDFERAANLYTESYDKCIWKNRKKLSYEASTRLTKIIAENYLDKEVSQKDTSMMDATEYYELARWYEALGEHEKYNEYLKLAAEKGNSYCACLLGVRCYKSSKNRTEELEKKAFDFFAKGAKGNYAPCKYNLAIMYIYGYGTVPDYDKAWEMCEQYINLIRTNNEYYDQQMYLPLNRILDDYSFWNVKSGLLLLKELEFSDTPQNLYSSAKNSENKGRPEIPIYFYTRAIQEGHPQAAEELEKYKKRLQEKNDSIK
jgi:TPR repeat protein